jgi:DNA-binding MurR/RpiR family transcriptional regulator
MGFQGFTELQSVFRQHLRDRVPDYEARLAALSGADAPSKLARLFESFCAAGEHSLDAARRTIDAEKLDRAVELLAGAETVYLAGLRRSFPLVSYMAYAFGKLGVRHVLLDAVAGLSPEAASFAQSSDALFAISFAPYAAETIAIVGQSAERGVPIVGVTDTPFSPLAQRATLWFEIAEADVEGFRSLSASLALAMTLTVAVAERRRG